MANPVENEVSDAVRTILMGQLSIQPNPADTEWPCDVTAEDVNAAMSLLIGRPTEIVKHHEAYGVPVYLSPEEQASGVTLPSDGENFTVAMAIAQACNSFPELAQLDKQVKGEMKGETTNKEPSTGKYYGVNKWRGEETDTTQAGTYAGAWSDSYQKMTVESDCDQSKWLNNYTNQHVAYVNSDEYKRKWSRAYRKQKEWNEQQDLLKTQANISIPMGSCNDEKPKQNNNTGYDKWGDLAKWNIDGEQEVEGAKSNSDDGLKTALGCNIKCDHPLRHYIAEQLAYGVLPSDDGICHSCRLVLEPHEYGCHVLTESHKRRMIDCTIACHGVVHYTPLGEMRGNLTGMKVTEEGYWCMICPEQLTSWHEYCIHSSSINHTKKVYKMWN